jgi:hypothetical protein
VNEREIKLASLGGQNYAESDRNRIPDFVSDGGEEFGAVREVSPERTARAGDLSGEWNR